MKSETLENLLEVFPVELKDYSSLWECYFVKNLAFSNSLFNNAEIVEDVFSPEFYGYCFLPAAGNISHINHALESSWQVVSKYKTLPQAYLLPSNTTASHAMNEMHLCASYPSKGSAQLQLQALKRQRSETGGNVRNVRPEGR